MRKFGLIGYPLGHSFSQPYFTKKFEEENIDDAVYELFPLENIDDIRLLFEINRDLHGLSVTIPYKESVIEYLDELDITAKEISAVNCIKINDPEFLREKKGYNTDCLGFRDSIQPLLQKHHKKALILGTGGSSKAVAFALKELGIQYTFVSRKKTASFIPYEMLDKNTMEENPVIVNCTPAGMYPAIENAPAIPYQFLNSNHLCFDLVYNPGETLFLQKAKQQGASVKNGLEMLQLQAEYAWKIWNG
ncbi:MAG: shikimate dehydrogenase family protein [Chitinophagales bacterium]